MYDEILVKRTIHDNGKSKAFINDNLISLNILKNILNNLIEIHSQFSEQGLLDSNTHILRWTSLVTILIA